MSNDEHQPSVLLRAMLECFATGNVDRVAEIVSEQYYDHQSSEWPRPHGSELFRAVVAGARKSLSELHLEIDMLDAIDPFQAESRTRWHWTDDTGLRRVRTTIDRIRMEGVQVVEHWGREVAS